MIRGCEHMKKNLNQKGMTSVELLVTFTILSFVIVGLFDVVLNYKDKEQKESVRNIVIDYENKLQKTIQDDLIKKHLTNVVLNNSIDANKISITINIGSNEMSDSDSTEDIITSSTLDINSPLPVFMDEETSSSTRQLVIDFADNSISYGAADNLISYYLSNNVTINKDKTYIETVGTDKSFLVIKVSFNHPDFVEDELSFSIICPINYPTNF